MPVVFDFPLLLWLIPLCAGAGWVLAWSARRRRIGRAESWSAELGATAASDGPRGAILIGIAAAALAVALAGPRWGRTSVTTETRALDLVIAMDISRSMLAEDQPPSRLGRAVREARRLVQDLQGDRLGLIAFAGRSYILTPLTIDGGALGLFLDGLDPDLASEGGTHLAPVLAQGRQLLTAGGETGADRVLVLFTDGEGHDSTAEITRQAEALREAGVRLVIVAVGAGRPTRIPVRNAEGVIVEYQTDGAGGVVQTKRDDRTLEQVADAAEAALVPADLPDQAGAVRDLVHGYRRAPSSETRTADLIPRAWLPMLFGFIILATQAWFRRGAALVGLFLCFGAPALTAQRPAAGTEAFDAGDPRRAARTWLDRAGRGGGDTAWYNAGTAAMEAGELEVAKQALATAARALDPELRYRALYNLGTLAIRQAQADSTRRERLLEEAETHLREALMLQPTSARAKWNLELAVRRRPPPPPPSGGGGGSPPPPPSGEGGPPPPPEPRSSSTLTPGQAEQILNSVEREERETRARHQRRGRSSAAGVKNW
jgi:Ca-activated chloride channel family protein